jgi:hypothetical protein
MVCSNCKADHLFFEREAETDVPCNVEIDNGKIRVWYENLAIPIYEGQENGAGHFELHALSGNGRGTLHRFDGSKCLEGFWVEDGYRGMWRITLA